MSHSKVTRWQHTTTAIIVLALVFGGSLSPILGPPEHAAAASPCDWVTSTTISCGGFNFAKQSQSGSIMTLLAGPSNNSPKGACNPVDITMTIDSTQTNATANLVPPASTGGCMNVILGNLGSQANTGANGSITVTVSGSSASAGSSGGGGGGSGNGGSPNTCTWTNTAANNTQLTCDGIIYTANGTVSGGGVNGTTMTLVSTKDSACVLTIPNYGTATSVKLCDGTQATIAADFNTVAGIGGGGGGGGGGTAAPPTCEGTLGPMGWILCAVFNTIADASQWLLTNIIQPFLITAPVSTNPSDSSYKVWSQFRIYGDVFLIFALLVIVFGQSIGGGVIDAYTAKKVLPRLLIAAILINLSLYIVALMVDLTNVIGQGIGDVLTEPLRASGAWSFKLGGTQIAGVFSVGLIGLIASTGAIAAIVATIGTLTAATAGAAVISLFFILLPMILAVIAVFVTLVIRKGIILVLLLISPVAFALYCLPNTEKYFRKWWDALLTTLMVYPIVMAVFAVGDLLSVTILEANSIKANDLSTQGAFQKAVAGSGSEILAVIIAFVAQFLPLFLIPFAFRLAGGLLGRVHEFSTAAKNRTTKMTESRRAQERDRMHGLAVQGRQKYYSSLQNYSDDHKGFRKAGARLLAGRVGGYNIEAEASAVRAQRAETLNKQIATGNDDEIRGLTVNKRWARSQGPLSLDSDGWMSNGQFREKDGKRQFKSLGGRWVDEAQVDAGHRRWGRDSFAQQAALSYEMRKAQTEDEMQGIASNYHNLQESWGLSDGQMAGNWIGASFENQSSSLAYKYTDWKTGNFKSGGAKGYAKEIYEGRGNYNFSQQKSWNTKRLMDAYQDAGTDVDTKQQIAAIAQTYTNDMGMGGGYQYGEGEGGRPLVSPSVPGLAAAAQQQGMANLRAAQSNPPGTQGAVLLQQQAAAAGGSTRMTQHPGAAHAGERMHQLAIMTGVDRAEPSGQYTDPTHTAQTDHPDTRSQNRF